MLVYRETASHRQISFSLYKPFLTHKSRARANAFLRVCICSNPDHGGKLMVNSLDIDDSGDLRMKLTRTFTTFKYSVLEINVTYLWQRNKICLTFYLYTCSYIIPAQVHFIGPLPHPYLLKLPATQNLAIY